MTSKSMHNYAGWKSRDSVPRLVQDYMAGKMKVDEFVTHTMPLVEINNGFQLMHEGKRRVQFFVNILLSTTLPTALYL